MSSCVKYRKAWALWAFLGMSRGQVHARSVLAEWLWPSLEATAAKANLRQVIGDIRGLLKQADLAPCLLSSAQAVGLSRDGRLSIDVELLRQWARATQSGDEAGRDTLPDDGELDALPIADFLQGWHLPPLPGGNDWLQGMRDACTDALSQVLEFQARRAEQQGRLHAAVGAARRLLALAPSQESHAMLLADLLRRHGLQDQADRVLKHSVSMIEAQLDSTPQALMDLIAVVDPKAQPLPASRPAEWRRVVGIYSDAPQDLHTDDQAVQAWWRVWSGLVERRHGLPVRMPGIGWAAVFGLDDACPEPARSACQLARDWLSLGLTEQLRAGVADQRLLIRRGLSPDAMVGHVVHEAMRVCWQAIWGAWLATREVVLASRETGFAAHDERTGAALYVGPATAEPLSATAETVTLIGRHQEMDWLMQRWQAVESGGSCGMPVWVEAPAGWGKSCLVRTLADEVQRRDGHVFRVVCSWGIQAHPMMPWVQALGQGTATSNPEIHDRQFLRRRVIEHVRAMALKRPLLVWMEDVHWADQATLDYLPVLVRQMAPLPVLLVMTARPTVDRRAPMAVDTLALDALSTEASRQLLQTSSGASPIGDALQDRLVQASAGVPLVLQWLARSRAALGPAHAGLQVLVQEQLDALGPGRTVLRAAAVLGDRFTVPMLQALLPQHAIRTVLIQAGHLHVLHQTDDDGWAFGHALVREVIYESAAPDLRLSWHAQAARYLESTAQVPADQVARHWQAAQAWPQAAQWWRHAGDAALERDFAADALICYGCATEALAQDTHPTSNAAFLASLQVQMGHCRQMTEGFGSPQAWQLFGQVESELRDRSMADDDWQDLRFSALAGRYMGSSSQGEVGGLGLAHALSALARRPEQQLMASYALGNSLFWLGRLDEARQALEEVAMLSDRLSRHHRLLYCTDDPAVICRAFLSWLTWLQGDQSACRRWMQETIALLGPPLRPHAQCFARTLLMCACWCQGDWDEVRDHAEQVYSLSHQYQFVLWEAVSALLLTCHQAAHEVMQDIAVLHAAAQQMQGAYQAGVTTSRWMVATALMSQQRHSQAEALLELTYAEADLHEDQYCVPQLLWLLAQCKAQRGAAREAAQLKRQARERAQRMGALGVLRQWSGDGPGSELADAVLRNGTGQLQVDRIVVRHAGTHREHEVVDQHVQGVAGRIPGGDIAH